jgi:CubicO group peptidase (beta-lactamase class C family)
MFRAKPNSAASLCLALCAAAGATATPPDEQASEQFLRTEEVAAQILNRDHLQAAAAYSDSFSGRALLVMQNGQVIFEHYANGWTASRPHALASGTKSFAGIVAMAAIEDGIINGLDEVVADTLTEWKLDSRKSEITVRQLLNLSSGLAPDDDSLGRAGAGIRDLGPANDAAGRLRGALGRDERPEDRFAAAIAIPSIDKPGRTFRYGPSHFYAFGAFLERKLESGDRPQKSYFEYMKARVLEPAGLSASIERFAPDRAGNPNLPGGGHLTAREWAKFGEFVRLGGAVCGEDGPMMMHFKPGALEPCFQPSDANPNYGLTWWLLNGKPGAAAEVADVGARSPRTRRGGGQASRQAAQTEAILDQAGEPIPVAMAAGAGKQRLYILPKQGLVIVRFAQMNAKGAAFSDTEFIQTVLGLAGGAPVPAEAHQEKKL